MSSFKEMSCLQNSKYTASPLVRRLDTETEENGNCGQLWPLTQTLPSQITVKAKFVSGKAFMMKVENRQFIKDSRKGWLAEATFALLIKCVGSSERRCYFIILVCSPTSRRRALVSVSR